MPTRPPILANGLVNSALLFRLLNRDAGFILGGAENEVDRARLRGIRFIRII